MLRCLLPRKRSVPLRIAQALSRAAVRTVYYREAAKLFGCEYSSHPIRNSFNLKCILFDNHPFTRKKKLHSEEMIKRPKDRDREKILEYYGKIERRDSYYSDVNHFFRTFWQECNAKDDNIFGVETFDIDLPPFLSYAIKRCGSSDAQNVIEQAFELREDKHFRFLRERLKYAYEGCHEEQRHIELRKLAYEFRILKQQMQVYLGYDREKISLSAKVVSYGVTVPRFMTKPFYPGRPHLALIRDIILELSSVSTLGRQIDYLWNHSRKY